ncbi:MAG: hypothetical protein JXM71_00990, partial [Spirochaetales bacterium]|nr:hypothetical protein [Spirochaetales bacterium]
QADTESSVCEIAELGRHINRMTLSLKERDLVMAEGPTIEANNLLFYGPTIARACAPGNIPDGIATAVPASSPCAGGANDVGQLARMEMREISAALKKFDGQMARAAEYLGINRKTLREKMHRYGLNQD